MSERLIDYLYRKTQDTRLKVMSSYNTRSIIAEIYLAKLRKEKVTYTKGRMYELENGFVFYFEKSKELETKDKE